MLKPIKVILICGGDGTRVRELTDGITPKAFVRLSKKVPKPLLAYQLDQIKKIGVKEILLIPQYKWQTPMHKHSIRNKEYPIFNYHFELWNANHPFNIFRDKKVKDFIGKSDFVFSYGDIFYSAETLKKMSKMMGENHTSIASGMYSKSKRWRKRGKFLSFLKNKDGKITDINYSDKLDFTIHAPFLFENRALKSIHQEIKNKNPRTISLLSRLINKNQLSVTVPELLVNMTTIEDANKIEKFLRNYKY